MTYILCKVHSRLELEFESDAPKAFTTFFVILCSNDPIISSLQQTEIEIFGLTEVRQ